MVYSNSRYSALTESSDVSLDGVEPLNGHIMDFTLECVRNEQNLFESIIEMDFMEAHGLITEAEDDSTKEGAKKTLWEKIKDLFKKAITTIKRFFADAINRIKNMLSNDRKLVATYERFFKEENLKDFYVYDYQPITKDFTKSTNILDRLESVVENEVKKIGNVEDFDKTLSELKDEFKETDYRKAFEEGGTLTAFKVTVPGVFGKKGDGKENFLEKYKDQIDIILNTVKDGKNAINMLKANNNQAIGNLKKFQARLKYDVHGVEGDDLTAMNNQYKLCSVLIREVNKIASATVNIGYKALAVARKTFIKGAKYAKNYAENHESPKTESAFYTELDILGDMSDSYVESVLFA